MTNLKPNHYNFMTVISTISISNNLWAQGICKSLSLYVVPQPVLFVCLTANVHLILNLSLKLVHDSFEQQQRFLDCKIQLAQYFQYLHHRQNRAPNNLSVKMRVRMSKAQGGPSQIIQVKEKKMYLHQPFVIGIYKKQIKNTIIQRQYLQLIQVSEVFFSNTAMAHCGLFRLM